MKKKLLIMAFAAMVGGACFAAEQKIAVVDMNKLLRGHPETTTAETVLEAQVAEIEQEKEALMEKLGKLRDEVDAVMKQAQNRALSEAGRDALKSEAEEKYQDLRKMDFEAKKTLDSRKKDLSEQKLMMHKRIVGEIAEVIKEYAEKKGYAFVLDSAGIGMSRMPTVLHADAKADITEDIQKLIGKKKD